MPRLPERTLTIKNSLRVAGKSKDRMLELMHEDEHAFWGGVKSYLHQIHVDSTSLYPIAQPNPSFSPEIIAFLKEQGIQYLQKITCMVEDAFPFNLFYDDPETLLSLVEINPYVESCCVSILKDINNYHYFKSDNPHHQTLIHDLSQFLRGQYDEKWKEANKQELFSFWVYDENTNTGGGTSQKFVILYHELLHLHSKIDKPFPIYPHLFHDYAPSYQHSVSSLVNDYSLVHLTHDNGMFSASEWYASLPTSDQDRLDCINRALYSRFPNSWTNALSLYVKDLNTTTPLSENALQNMAHSFLFSSKQLGTNFSSEYYDFLLERFKRAEPAQATFHLLALTQILNSLSFEPSHTPKEIQNLEFNTIYQEKDCLSRTQKLYLLLHKEAQPESTRVMEGYLALNSDSNPAHSKNNNIHQILAWLNESLLESQLIQPKPVSQSKSLNMGRF